MRVARVALLALAAVLAAGCIAPQQGAPTSPALLGYCPQWLPGPGQADATHTLDAAAPNATQRVAGEAERDGRPLDVYRVRVQRLDVEGGHVELRARVEGNGTPGRNIYDFRQPAGAKAVPYLVLAGAANDTREYDVLLNPVAQGATLQPAAAVLLDWQFVPDQPGQGHATVGYQVTFLYRVCGAVVA